MYMLKKIKKISLSSWLKEQRLKCLICQEDKEKRMQIKQVCESNCLTQNTAKCCQ